MVAMKLFLTSNIFKNTLYKSNNFIYLRTISSTTKLNSQNDMIFEDINNAGVATFNRPKVMNAFTLSMIAELLQKLQQWKNEKLLVLIKGAGERAFCSGGDIKSVFGAGLKGDRLPYDMFRTGYTINGLIAHYPIPYVALIDGIVMGGGVGISVHGHYRICTERTMYAMPEAGIGLFPDIGSSYVLPRMQNRLGFYLGLTGARLKGSDVLKAGIATHYIESNKIQELEHEILKCNDHTSIKNVLNDMCAKDTPEFSLNPYLHTIEKCFSKNTMEEIVRELEDDGSDFAENALKLLDQMSPTSLKITLKSFEIGEKTPNLLECLQREYRMACACFRNHDIYEGVRSVLIDKDRNPKWRPKTLKEVPDSLVDSHFVKLPENEELRHKL